MSRFCEVQLQITSRHLFPATDVTGSSLDYYFNKDALDSAYIG